MDKKICAFLRNMEPLRILYSVKSIRLAIFLMITLYGKNNTLSNQITLTNATEDFRKQKVDRNGGEKWRTVCFQNSTCDFLWNQVIGIVFTACCKGTLYLSNWEVAFRKKSFQDKKTNITQDDVEVNCSTIICYPVEDFDDIALQVVDQQPVILPGY